VHQTFYIDIDEEITSIVERLRRSTAKEVVIVVPKRALLIQSIINLKLLKKEADELNKRIIIVTQDKFGKLMVEKTGIAVEQRLDDIGGVEIAIPEKARNNDKRSVEQFDPEASPKGENRLDKMGSPGFFDSNIAKKQTENLMSGEKVQADNIRSEKLTNTELVTDIGVSIKRRKKSGFEDGPEKADSGGLIRSIDIKQRSSDDFDKKGVVPTTNLPDSREKAGIKLRIGRGLFRKEKLPEKYEDKTALEPEMTIGAKKGVVALTDSVGEGRGGDYKNVSLSRKAWKFFSIFGSVAALVILLSAAYLFLPKAKVTIFSKTKTTSADLEVKADAKYGSVNSEEKAIPSRAISVSEEINENFDATGTKGASSHKARGMITIYNEYSSATQPLVATTRFLSGSGKLFRLVNSVIISGVTTVGAESKPGAIEAEVVADEAGEEFNIEPSKFSIPGFQNSGNEKYTKIYAKSFKTMTGGGTGGEMVKTMTDADISSAKNRALSEINSKIKEKLKNESGEGYVILDESMNFGDPVYKISNSSGDIVDNFTVNLKLDAKALIFREADLNDILISIIGKSAGPDKKVIEDSITQEFGKAEADFTNSVLKIKVNAGAKIAPVLDLDSIKKGLLGKSTAELEAYLKDYSDIARVEVEYWPAFISGRIPQYGSRVEIELDNN
jgi:hypothetical protein